MNIVLAPECLIFQPVLGKWQKYELSKHQSRRDKYYGYDVNVPRPSVQAWLEQNCPGSYRMNIFKTPVCLYFEHEMLALQFKLALE
jgi:hypothetical protein